MAKTIPIKRKENIGKIKEYFIQKKEYRNYLLIILGVNTALRISDILSLKWKNLYNFDKNVYCEHLYINEKKTKKNNCIAINSSIQEALDLYRAHYDINPSDYLLKSRNGINQSISRNRAYTIISTAAAAVGLNGKISCHSLRKTFGYHAWKTGIPPAIIMAIYNHSSMEITRTYLSIDQDDKDELFLNINL